MRLVLRCARFAAVLALATLLAASCRGDGSNHDREVEQVRQLVEQFGGRRLSRVSLLAEEPDVRRQIREEYGSFATRSLIARWLADPSTALGQRVSSL